MFYSLRILRNAATREVLHRLLPVRAPKGLGGEGGKRTTGAPPPPERQKRLTEGVAETAKRGETPPPRVVLNVGNLADNRARASGPGPVLEVGGW